MTEPGLSSEAAGDLVRRLSQRHARAADADGTAPAGILSRAVAVAIDLAVLAAIDVLVVYFTMQICGLTAADLNLLPKAPLLAFLLVQNGGYLVAFTAGGQTLGKMAMGIKVVSDRHSRAGRCRRIRCSAPRSGCCSRFRPGSAS